MIFVKLFVFGLNFRYHFFIRAKSLSVDILLMLANSHFSLENRMGEEAIWSAIHVDLSLLRLTCDTVHCLGERALFSSSFAVIFFVHSSFKRTNNAILYSLILANTPDQAETLLHSLERAAANIGLYVNAHKMEYMCYNQTGDISTLEGTSLKLVDKFTYLGSSVESTEKDIETRLAKAWTAINRLSIIWKSDLTDKMKRSFFLAAVTSILLYSCTTWTLTKRLEKKLDGNYTRMLRAILNKSWR